MALGIKYYPPGGINFDCVHRETKRQSYFFKEIGYSEEVGFCVACSKLNIPVLNNYHFCQLLFCVIDCSDQRVFSTQIVRLQQQNSVIVLKIRGF